MLIYLAKKKNTQQLSKTIFKKCGGKNATQKPVSADFEQVKGIKSWAIQ
jgi:hypothetical protein